MNISCFFVFMSFFVSFYGWIVIWRNGGLLRDRLLEGRFHYLGGLLLGRVRVVWFLQILV